MSLQMAEIFAGWKMNNEARDMDALETEDRRNNVFQGIYSFIQQIFIEYH